MSVLSPCPHLVPTILDLVFRKAPLYWFLILCFLFFLSFSGTTQYPVGLLEALVLCVQNNHQSENLNRFTCKKSEDVLRRSVSRIKTSLLNLDGSRLSILQDCIYSLGIFISCVFIAFYDSVTNTQYPGILK